MQQMLAFIFPAPSTAYLAGILFPPAGVLSLAVEIVVLRHFQVGLVSAWRTVLTAICANTVSWWAGIAMSWLLPSGDPSRLVPAQEQALTMTERGPYWDSLAIASFFFACAASVVIEYGFLRTTGRWFPCRRPALCATVANVSSYCVLGVVFAAYVYSFE
jgi:hypothetical protein